MFNYPPPPPPGGLAWPSLEQKVRRGTCLGWESGMSIVFAAPRVLALASGWQLGAPAAESALPAGRASPAQPLGASEQHRAEAPAVPVTPVAFTRTNAARV